jgi:Eukaryotic cytochrome b561
VAITEDTHWLYAYGYDDNHADTAAADTASWGPGQSTHTGTFQLSLSPTCTRLHPLDEEVAPFQETPIVPRMAMEEQEEEPSTTTTMAITVQSDVDDNIDDDVVEEQLEAEEEQAEEMEDALDDEADALEDAADDAEEEEEATGEQPTTTVPPSDGGATDGGQGGQPLGNCPFSVPIALDSAGDLELEQYVDEASNTFTMKLTYYGGQAWIGVGINDNGVPAMSPATAVVGRAAEGNSPATVQKYRLSDGQAQLADTSLQTLVSSSFEQTADTSILTFTQLLTEEGQVAITDTTQWIFAIGFDGNQWGFHRTQGSFQVALTPGCNGTSSSAGGAESEPPATTVPSECAIDGDQGGQPPQNSSSVPPGCTLSEPIPLDSAGDLELEQYVDEASNSYTMKLTYYGGQAWIGVGINQDGVPKMSPSIAVVGRAAEGDSPATVEKYSLSSGWQAQLADTSFQTLVSSSFEQTADTSTLIFTQLLSEEGEVPVTDTTQWIFAVGFDGNQWGGHRTQGSFQLALTPSCDGTSTSEAQAGKIVITAIAPPNRTLWMTHGVLMAMAWGLLAPMAVGAAILRVFVDRLAGEQNKGMWFKIHFYLNVLVFLFTIAGCTVAFVAKREQKIDGVKSVKSIHGRIGISILVLVVLQVLAGYFRPALPKPPKASEDDHDADCLNRTEDPAALPPEQSMPKKSSLRMVWEVLHRLSGMALLAMAWYNCHTGILQSTLILEDYNDWTGAFWSVIGAFGALILMGNVVINVSKSP